MISISDPSADGRRHLERSTLPERAEDYLILERPKMDWRSCFQ
jgi:hypothetical protein